MARVKLDEIVVIDLEATCWEPKNSQPANEKQEIIEIGVCLLNPKTGARTKKQGILIKPTMSKVSTFCTELTTLTQEQLDAEGISFKEAVNKLTSEYASANRVMASFGDYDRDAMMKQCHQMGVKYPFSKRHINVKTLVSLHLGMLKEVGLARSCKDLGIDMDGTHHRGVDDAWNTAAVLSRVLSKKLG